MQIINKIFISLAVICSTANASLYEALKDHRLEKYTQQEFRQLIGSDLPCEEKLINYIDFCQKRADHFEDLSAIYFNNGFIEDYDIYIGTIILHNFYLLNVEELKAILSMHPSQN